MEEAIKATKALLEALNCRPEDEDYKQRFQETLDKERERAAEERRLVREHELALAREKAQQANPVPLNNGAPADVPPPRIYVDILPFAPANERADRFIHRLEHILKREKVPEIRYAEHLLKALPSTEAALLLNLPVEDQFNYKTLKETFLRRHKVTEAQLREDFRNARPSKDDNTATFMRTLQRAFDYWVEATGMERNFEELSNRIIADQLTDLLPNHLLVLLREKQAHTVDDITKHLDAYFDARPNHGLYHACQSANKNHGTSKPTPNNRQGAAATKSNQGLGTGKTTLSVQPAPGPHSSSTGPSKPQASPITGTSTLKPATAPASRASPSSGTPAGNSGRSRNAASPRGCSHHGPSATHTSEQCFVLHPERRPRVPPAGDYTLDSMPTALPTPPRSANVALSWEMSQPESPASSQPVNEDTIPQDGPVQALTALTPSGGPQVKGGIRTCSGTLNATPVKVLLDTGCDTIFVAQRLVDHTEYTGRTKPVRTAMGLHPGCPVAKVTFGCPYFPGGPTLVVVLEDPPYDVLLGQVPGTIKFSEEPSPSPASNGGSSPLGHRDSPTDDPAISKSCLQLPLLRVEGTNCLPPTRNSVTRPLPSSGATKVSLQHPTSPSRSCTNHGLCHRRDLYTTKHPTILPPYRDPDNWRQTVLTPPKTMGAAHWFIPISARARSWGRKLFA